MFLTFKRCGYESSRILSSVLFIFIQFASVFVFILDFVHNWVYIFESDMRLYNKYTRSTMNTFTKPTCN